MALSTASMSEEDARGGGEPAPTTLGALPDRPAPDKLVRDVARARIASKLFATQDVVKLGRYHLLEMVGAGGMGVVWGAWDPELDRRVAIKLVKAAREASRERILLEGQALAKLSHPNVVPVYDVGVVDEQVYLVMEWVRGENLRAYATQRRSVGEIVAVYRAAAEGLSAAHRAELIHRDFKPDNAMLGDDGRVRVLDFGLARDEVGPITSGSTSAGELTRGAGTPQYMAPEQVEGTQLTPAVDQYAFGVALREALAGRDGIDATKADVPRWLAEIIERTTARDPLQRYASMDAMLRALARDPATVRRRWLVGVGAIGFAGVAFTGGVLRGGSSNEPAPCQDGAAVLASTWNPGRAQQLASRFAEAGATSTWNLVNERIDRFTTAWVAGHEAACRATHVHASQSAAMLDRRTQCLASARARFDAGLTVLERDPHAIAGVAVDVVAALPDVTRCADVAALSAQPPLPTDPVLRPRIDIAVAQLAAARMSRFAVPDLALAARALAAARDTSWPPVIAEAMLVLGELQRERGLASAGESLREAATLALANGSDELAAWAMANLAWDTGEDSRAEDAKLWSGLAHGLWTRVGEPPQLGVRVAGAQAMAAVANGAPADALVATRRQVALATRVFGDDPIARAANHKNLANALLWAGQLPQARLEIDEAIKLVVATLGDGHPMTGEYFMVAASIAAAQGQVDLAVTNARRAVDIPTRWYGPDAAALVTPLEVLGGIFATYGEVDQARKLIDRSLAIRARHGDRPNAALGETLVNLAVAEVGRGDLPRALELGNRGLAMLEATRGPNHPGLANALVLLGYIERARNHFTESARHLERAVSITSLALGPSHVDTINPRIELANTHLAAGRPGEAVTALQPALDLVARDPQIPPQVAAEARFVFAEAAWRTGDREHARAAATAARDTYLTLGEPFAAQHAAARQWLVAHGGR